MDFLNLTLLGNRPTFGWQACRSGYWPKAGRSLPGKEPGNRSVDLQAGTASFARQQSDSGLPTSGVDHMRYKFLTAYRMKETHHGSIARVS